MKPRITINLSAEGIFEIWLNAAGRDLLVRGLQSLNENSDHLHLATPDFYDDITLSSQTYRPTDRLLDMGKIIFRTDARDQELFPHVLDTNS